jgi:hypothetical protein
MRWLTQPLWFGVLTAALAGNVAAQRGYMSSPAAVHTTTRGVSPTGGRLYPVPRNYPAPLGLRPPVAGYTGILPGALKSHGPHGRLPFAYWAAPYYYPSVDYSDAGYGAPAYDPATDPNVQAAMAAQNALVDQVQKLSAQVAQLQVSQQAPLPQEPAQPQVPVTLILRNGQQLQVQNYAVMSQTFWDFTNQTARKIPIANIDIAASTRATEANGGEFPQLPTTR